MCSFWAEDLNYPVSPVEWGCRRFNLSSLCLDKEKALLSSTISQNQSKSKSVSWFGSAHFWSRTLHHPHLPTFSLYCRALNTSLNSFWMKLNSKTYFRSAPDTLQPWMPRCPKDQIRPNSKENFLEMCIVWTNVYRSAFMGSQNLKTWPKWPQINVTLELWCSCLRQLYQRPKVTDTQNFLNSKVITEKSDLQTMTITGSFSYPRSLAVWCCTAWELEEYFSSCWWSSTPNLVLLQYPAVA